MALSDLYEAIDFTDTSGPGCGQVGHGADCLCDVPDIDVPVGTGRLDFGYYTIANKVLGHAPKTGADFVIWAAELMGAFEAVLAKGASLPGGLGRVEELVGSINEKRSIPSGRYGWGSEVKELFQMGLSFECIANLAEVTMHDVVRVISDDHEPNVVGYLALERLLRQGVRSWYEAAELTGLSRSQIRCFATRLGFESEASKKRKAGGGDKHGAETYEAVAALLAEGKGAKKIAKELSLPLSTVKNMIKRRGLRQAAA